ncbi:MAG: nucleotidyltransferase domain-containing protein [archaeon]
MLKKEYEILYEFAKSPWKKFTEREIKQATKKKSESYVYNTLKKFSKNGILTEQKAGNVTLYSLNVNSSKACAYAGFCSEYTGWDKKHIPYLDLEKITAKTSAGFSIFIVTGSYAKGTEKKDSDIDIVLITEDCIDTKKIYADLRYMCEMNIPQIHLSVFRKSEFIGMLLDKKPNYGKEIAKNNLLLFGGENYYRIIGEAIKNGFNG